MMEKLLEKQNRTGDIKFAVNCEEIHVHRYILASPSPRHAAQFYGDLAEKDISTLSTASVRNKSIRISID